MVILNIRECCFFKCHIKCVYNFDKTISFAGILEHESFLSTIGPGLHLLKETVISSLRLAQDSPNSARKIVLAGELLPMNEKVFINNYLESCTKFI